MLTWSWRNIGPGFIPWSFITHFSFGVNMKSYTSRMRIKLWLYSLEPPALAIVSLILTLLTELSIFAWIVPVFIFVALPIMDYRSPEDRTDPEAIAERLTPYRHTYEWIVRGYAPLQWLVNLVGVFCLAADGASALMLLGAVLTVGMINGMAIAPAHELNHQPGWVNRIFAVMSISPSFYGQFLVEHNRGHHVKVATPEDPASARLGEGFWEFSIRSVFMGLVSACALEYRALKINASLKKIFGSRLLQSWTLSASIFALVYWFAGLKVLALFAAQAIVGILLLEVVNYIEHYGLLRGKVNGRYLPCTPEHSWSSNKLVTNIGLYNLQRHADHHAYPTRPYEMLRHYKDAPEHPSGYAAMIVLALFPPLWFKIMDKRVLDLYDGDASKANVHPRKLKKYLKSA